MKKSVILAKKTLEPKTYKFEILVCFWLTLHMKLIDFAKYMLDQDPLLEKILSNLRKSGKRYIAMEKEREMKEIDEEETKMVELKKRL